MKKISTSLFLLYSSLTMAQTPCDSLDIDVKYSAFSDSLIQVNVINHNTGSFLSYPQFTLFDANGDTVGHEPMTFFGIGQASQHTLNVHPGMPASNTFTGTLQLYYVTVDSYAVCTWNMNFDLCPDTCVAFHPYIQNTGSQLVLGTANWEIRNNSQQPVATGSFTLDSSTQSAHDTVCLAAGIYTYKVTNVNMTAGGQKYIGVYGDNGGGPLVAFNNTVDSISLNLYEACQQTTKVQEITKGTRTVTVYSYHSNVFIQNISGRPIGNVSVYDMNGRIVYSEHVQQATQQIGLSGLPQGIYIIRVVNNAGSDMSKVMIGD